LRKYRIATYKSERKPYIIASMILCRKYANLALLEQLPRLRSAKTHQNNLPGYLASLTTS
jgi:hypothetical protein